MTERTQKQKLKALHKARKKLGLSKMGMKPPTFGQMLRHYVDFKTLKDEDGNDFNCDIPRKRLKQLLLNGQPTIEELVLIAHHTGGSLQFWVGLATGRVVYDLYHK